MVQFLTFVDCLFMLCPLVCGKFSHSFGKGSQPLICSVRAINKKAVVQKLSDISGVQMVVAFYLNLKSCRNCMIFHMKCKNKFKCTPIQIGQFLFTWCLGQLLLHLKALYISIIILSNLSFLMFNSAC